MTKRSTARLDPDSPVNSVTSRLALYSVLAGVVGAGTAIAINRHNKRDAADLADRADQLSGEHGGRGVGAG